MTLVGGRYELLRRLGQPSLQGEVYEARDTHEDDVIAIKLMANMAPGTQWNEARILRRLGDRHILPIRNADTDHGRPYLVTELATGGSLDALVNNAGDCGLDIDDVIRWVRHACGGVARGHDLGLLHNDIKPANLFLDGERECLVGDFGLASLIPPGAATTQAHGCTFETVAPEVAGDVYGDSASFASDIYSVGATAYWMIAGHPWVDVRGLAPMDALAKIASSTPTRLFDLAPHVPTQVQAAIEQAMAADPAQRFRTPGEFAAALGRSSRRPGRRWQRTDDHLPHIACFTGTSPKGASTLTLCVEQGARPSRVAITTRSSGGGRVMRACRPDAPSRTWASAVRSAIRDAR